MTGTLALQQFVGFLAELGGDFILPDTFRKQVWIRPTRPQLVQVGLIQQHDFLIFPESIRILRGGWHRGLTDAASQFFKHPGDYRGAAPVHSEDNDEIRGVGIHGSEAAGDVANYKWSKQNSSKGRK